MKNVLPLSENDFDFFQQLLVEESGLYFDKDRSDSLRHALWERLQNRKYDSYQEYFHFLKYHPEGLTEIREIIDLITIGETYFFRNRPQFDALMKRVLPEIIERKMYSVDKSIRVWSAGCSKGDEPYSIAIAIMEVLPSYENWDISILGTDVNRNALVCAKNAVYNKKDIGHLPQGYLDKYFEKRGSKYILNQNVKKLVRFEDYNLARAPFNMEQMKNLDILFCRNVTIYFNLQTTKRVIENFYNCLKQDGYLFLGHSETLWQITNKFETVEFPQTFIYRKAINDVEEEAMRPFVGVPKIKLDDFAPVEKTFSEEYIFFEEAEPAEEKIETFEITEETEIPPEPEKQESVYREASKLFTEKKYEQALSLFDQIIAQDKNHIRAYFAKANILANQAKYEEAINTLTKIIEVDNLYVEAYYLLGVLLYKEGNYEEAERQFRRAIYVDPSIVLAYFNLGNIYLYLGKYDKASKEFNNTIKLLEGRPVEEQVKFCEDFTVEFLLRACKNNLEEIPEKAGLYE